MMGCFEGPGTEELLELGQGMNRKFLFWPPQAGQRQTQAWRGDLPKDIAIPLPVFGIHFGVKPKRAACWVFGSNTNLSEIDFQIAKHNRRGVSKQCFKIDFVSHLSPPTLRITNLAESSTLSIRHGEGDGAEIVHRTCGESYEVREPVIVQHRKFRFRMWLPKRTKDQHAQFMAHVREMDERANAEPPEYWPSLEHGPVTIDEDSRMSPDGTVYTRIPDMPQRNGATGLVFLVHEFGPKPQASTRMLCAKQMHWGSSSDPGKVRHLRERIEQEFKSYQRYSHVGIPNSSKHRVTNANGQHHSRTLLPPSILPTCILARPHPG